MQSSRNITAKKYLIDPAMKTEVEKSTDNFILDQLKNLNLNLYDDKKNIEDITRKQKMRSKNRMPFTMG